MKRRVLLIEDELSMRLGVSHALTAAGYEVTACEDGNEGLEALNEHGYDLILTDLRLPGLSGMEILTEAREICPETGVIIITAFPEIHTAVSAIKKGAFDYLSKPFTNEALLIVIERYFSYRELQLENDRLKETIKEKSQSDHFIGESSAMKAVFDRLATVAPTDVPVRIQGESGTGKELVASALHNLSQRKDKPYLKINCAAIPEDLLESELFGHEKGAFTGAVQEKKGKFEVADGGTIFFDEIGDMPLGLQAKLLRVLEDQEITRLGSHKSTKVNVRTIFATAKDLKKAIKERTFREDLFYRINVVPIHLPPLRERGEDITALAEHFLKIYSAKYGKEGLDISPDAYKSLLAYDYPGNVRELKNAIERAVLLSTGSHIHVTHLPSEFRRIAEDLPCITEDMPLDEGVKCYERQRILKALEETKGKKIEAAAKLGISRKVLWKKLKDLDIEC
ncbi:sigma-54-dependent Fis family transcriptional regulator [Desulfolithobacter dissulfuricans]|uniref:Sigma-54-dependent Fis family transcriptional regulator n=1 Tax=Desulfolithobacter dissulfuricans TaxID=2795293 RepID=A0A915U0A8_9BACT|nr:sigma-54 dependent transcriptional regulator [Desulfolithobacter dissulfuricans]BCO08042.1 sigma-54-dependent Fis family transcriptional regulator [Desulfolithobacter dissulfuricans]